MKIKQVTIYKVDLNKLMSNKKLNLKTLATKAGVNYEYLLRCKNGLLTMSEDHWSKIKKHL